MAHLTDLRAMARHGEAYLRAKTILTVAMIVAEADRDVSPADTIQIMQIAKTLPVMADLPGWALRAASDEILYRISNEGAEEVFAEAEARMSEKMAVQAVLLATIVAQGGADIGPVGKLVLRPMVKRLGLTTERFAAIETMAKRRLSATRKEGGL